MLPLHSNTCLYVNCDCYVRSRNGFLDFLDRLIGVFVVSEVIRWGSGRVMERFYAILRIIYSIEMRGLEPVFSPFLEIANTSIKLIILC